MLIKATEPCPLPMIDTHAHYDDSAYDGCRDALIDELEAYGIKAIINNSTDQHASADCCLRLSREHACCYSAYGVHPQCLDDNGPLDIDSLAELLKDKKCVALGEIGLDYHYTDENAALQREVFCRQLELAGELDIPVIVHDREAHSDTLEILKKYRPKGVVHCFSGSLELAREVIALGMYLGIGGVLTYGNARKLVEVTENSPLDRLLLETDAPYLPPTPFRGQRNDSSLMVKVAERAALLRGLTPEQFIGATTENAEQLFNFNK